MAFHSGIGCVHLWATSAAPCPLVLRSLRHWGTRHALSAPSAVHSVTTRSRWSYTSRGASLAASQTAPSGDPSPSTNSGLEQDTWRPSAPQNARERARPPAGSRLHRSPANRRPPPGARARAPTGDCAAPCGRCSAAPGCWERRSQSLRANL
jgi:hypothetical protein